MVRAERLSPDGVEGVLPLVVQYRAFESIVACDPARLAAALRRQLADPSRGLGWIAREAGEAVGYLLAVYVFSLEHLGLTVEIDEFFVAPAARGRGIGTVLLREAEMQFRRDGCTNLSLQLARGNAAARAFYRRQGYVARDGFELLDKTLASEGH